MRKKYLLFFSDLEQFFSIFFILPVMPQSELTVVPTLVQDQQCVAENHEIPEKKTHPINSNNISYVHVKKLNLKKTIVFFLVFSSPNFSYFFPEKKL